MNRSSTADSRKRPPTASPVFVTTRWSVVISAQGRNSPAAEEALEQLCRAYWYPLYAYVRRAGHPAADAEDLTQAFFALLLEKEWLGVAARERGRFRSFLLGALKHFLANEWDKARAWKRGGQVRWVSLDAPVGEDRLQHEPVAQGSPDLEFDRRWALTLLGEVLTRLEQEYARAGKGKLFGQLKSSLGGDREEVNYAQLAGELKMSEGAVRVAVHRLRQRYRELLREEIAQTVATTSEVEDELRQLFQALSG
jgi:RNA polymerase sigma factor (sigma-70 family)